MEIYPCRLVTGEPLEIRGGGRTVSFGVPELDAIFGGGLPIYSHLLVSGAAGAGKTIFSLQYAVQGVLQYQEPAAIFLYEETPGQLRHLANSFGWDLAALEKAGQMRLVFSTISDLNLDAHLQLIAQTVQDSQARRVVIDSLPGLLHPAGEDIYLISEKISELTRLLKSLGCTTLSTTRLGQGQAALSRFGVEESLVDGIILLKTVATGTHRKRSLEVYKLRGANPVMDEHRLQITPTGLKVFYTTLHGTPDGERRTDV
jgi:circadian clock protein KaiC